MASRLAPRSPKHDAILETAEVPFGAQGYARTSVEQIAAEANVSKPLVYRDYEGKKQLFEVVVERVIDAWCDVITAEAARLTPSG